MKTKKLNAHILNNFNNNFKQILSKIQHDRPEEYVNKWKKKERICEDGWEVKVGERKRRLGGAADAPRQTVKLRRFRKVRGHQPSPW